MARSREGPIGGVGHRGSRTMVRRVGPPLILTLQAFVQALFSGQCRERPQCGALSRMSCGAVFCRATRSSTLSLGSSKERISTKDRAGSQPRKGRGTPTTLPRRWLKAERAASSRLQVFLARTYT
jgi:hypothetical protein